MNLAGESYPYSISTMNPTPSPRSAEAAFERRMTAVTASVENYHTYLLDYLFRLTRQRQDAENLLQDLWRHVLLHFEESKISSFPLLRRKAYQLFIDHYRRQSRRGEVLSEETPEVAVQPNHFAAFTDAEEVALRRKFWAEYPTVDLTEPQKEALWLHARYGFTCKEIEQRLGVPSSTVGDWIALGRRRLAAVINNEPNK
jgi:DNA-directed RNA polymerase specialized sigma24 family protein